jgi:hypothetical protein
MFRYAGLAPKLNYNLLSNIALHTLFCQTHLTG